MLYDQLSACALGRCHPEAVIAMAPKPPHKGTVLPSQVAHLGR